MTDEEQMNELRRYKRYKEQVLLLVKTWMIPMRVKSLTWQAKLMYVRSQLPGITPEEMDQAAEHAWQKLHPPIAEHHQIKADELRAETRERAKALPDSQHPQHPLGWVPEDDEDEVAR